MAIPRVNQISDLVDLADGTSFGHGLQEEMRVIAAPVIERDPKTGAIDHEKIAIREGGLMAALTPMIRRLATLILILAAATGCRSTNRTAGTSPDAAVCSAPNVTACDLGSNGGVWCCNSALACPAFGYQAALRCTSTPSSTSGYPPQPDAAVAADAGACAYGPNIQPCDYGTDAGVWCCDSQLACPSSAVAAQQRCGGSYIGQCVPLGMPCAAGAVPAWCCGTPTNGCGISDAGARVCMACLGPGLTYVDGGAPCCNGIASVSGRCE